MESQGKSGCVPSLHVLLSEVTRELSKLSINEPRSPTGTQPLNPSLFKPVNKRKIHHQPYYGSAKKKNK